MNKYEAMFIFADDLKDEALEGALNRVQAEIKKSGGTVESATRLGRKMFGRPLHKREAGQYVLIIFTCGGEHISPLLAKYRLNEEVFRVTIMRAGATPLPAEKPVVAKETK